MGRLYDAYDRATWEEQREAAAHLRGRGHPDHAAVILRNRVWCLPCGVPVVKLPSQGRSPLGGFWMYAHAAIGLMCAAWAIYAYFRGFPPVAALYAVWAVGFGVSADRQWLERRRAQAEIPAAANEVAIQVSPLEVVREAMREHDRLARALEGLEEKSKLHSAKPQDATPEEWAARQPQDAR